MSAAPQNVLVNVATYQASMIGTLSAMNPWTGSLNNKFKNFTDKPNNLGDTVLLDLPPLVTTRRSLIADFDSAAQRQIPLTINEPLSSAIAFTTEDIVENDVMGYMDKWGYAIACKMGTDIGINLAQKALTETFRFYGDGRTPITSQLQLAEMAAKFRNFGTVPGMIKGYLSDMMEPNIVNSELNQFAPSRNDDVAVSWKIGKSSNTDWMITNILAEHEAGTEGINDNTLTVKTVITDTVPGSPTFGAVVALELSGTTSASDPNSFKLNDKIWIDNSGTLLPTPRYMIWNQNVASKNEVQLRVTADSASNGASEVTVGIYPPLYAAEGKNKNINIPIEVGMQIRVVGSRRSGLLVGGDAFYLAMPTLNDQAPFTTANKRDPKTGLYLRLTHGSQGPGRDFNGLVWDCIWGSLLVPEYAMEVCIPM